MNNTNDKNKSLLRGAFVVLGIVMLGTIAYNLLPRKEFPVKVGQTWKSEVRVIPYVQNKPMDEATISYCNYVYKIDKDGRIFYVRNKCDSFDLDVEGFLFNSTLEK